MIRDRLERFQDRVFRLREQLSEMEPDNAARLERVLQRTGELGLARQLDEIIRQLRETSSLNDVMDSQTSWMKDADQLLDILLRRDSSNEERERDIGRLEDYREKVSSLLARESELRDASAQASIVHRLMEQIQQALERLGHLQTDHQQVIQETDEESRSNNASLLEALAARELDLARIAAELAEDIERLSRLVPEAQADSPEAAAARGKIAEAAGELQVAAESMSKSSSNLADGDRESARKRQEAARQTLDEARARLEEARQQLKNLPDARSRADDQRKVAEDTGALSEDMRAGPPPDDAVPHDLPQSPAPGLENLDESRRRMGDAAESLDRDDPEKSAQAQEQAVEQLRQALRELDEALHQLRQEDRAEMLSDLESRFREMLDRQRGINDETNMLGQIDRTEWTRAERLRAADLATQERGLGEQADASVHILDEEGTTIVFPRVVGQLAEDMNTVADRLADLHVGALTQAMQEEIVSTLEQLLESIRRMQQENEQLSESDGPEGEAAPLLPASAELKLLRSSQLRVNTRTAAIEDAMDATTETDAGLRRALAEVAARQAECAEIAKEMRDRQEQP